MNWALLAQDSGSLWLPPQASTAAPEVDWVFRLVFWISLFFFVLIVGLAIFFVIRYRRREGIEAERTATHNMALELTWTGVPVVLATVIFVFGFKGFMNLTITPANTYQINVTGQKWKWIFEYPNGHVDEDLHVPVDQPVELVMTSPDVIHGFYIPAFRIQRDVVPGRYNKLWFQATTPGKYQIYCTQYCGTGHAEMTAFAVVHAPGEFENWLREASDLFKKLTPVQVGQRLYQLRCASCHTVDGTAGTGPTWKGVFGHKVEFADGTSGIVDENYIRRSILEPGAQITKGYEPVMPTFKGQLNDREIMAIIDYIKSLK